MDKFYVVMTDSGVTDDKKHGTPELAKEAAEALALENDESAYILEAISKCEVKIEWESAGATLPA